MRSQNEIISILAAFSKSERIRFYVGYAHLLTIIARMAVEDKRFEVYKCCNEALHRILGHTCAICDERTEPNDERTFDRMIVNSAANNGWIASLHKAVAITEASRTHGS